MNKHKNNLRTTICGALTGLMLLAGGQVYAQRTAQGHVVDESGFPIAGAIVTAGSKTATTDNKGRFRIEDATSLRIEMPGYMPQILDRLSDKMTVTLKEDDLQRSLSTPAGIRSRFGMASAVSTIQGDELNENSYRMRAGYSPASSPTDRRTNLRRTGQRFPVFYIRGLGSWNTSKPLIYVDGFEAPMDRLSPTEIESISVLKDAGALGPVRNKGSQRRDLDYDQTRFDRETQGESKSQPGMAGSGIAAQVHRLVHLCLPLQRSGQQRSRQMEPILHRSTAQCL